ncbi:MAG: putative lysine decarboxylase [Candidatus Methanolliviera sp. GoM_asphalt]|nr:MAG: putative lysine decarboxylase [Candidatus Methanolliviera sp. GoM_asphalt]
MQKKICVFSSSSDAVAPAFFEVATELGILIAMRGYTLIYGGGNVGLMGAIARTVLTNGGKVVGVILKSMQERGIAYENLDELVVTKSMHERKAIMEERADAFICLPGGFGTLEEMFEVLTLKQLNFHDKPVVFINTNGFYNHLIDLFDRIYKERFAKSDYRKLYFIAPDAKSSFSYIEAYQPIKFPSKWF